MTQHFGYAIDRRYLPFLLPFGLKRDRDGVTLADDGSFVATFGFFTLTTTTDNVTGAHITRNYRWWTAFGARASMADDGLSFGTNHGPGCASTSARRSRPGSAGAAIRRSPSPSTTSTD